MAVKGSEIAEFARLLRVHLAAKGWTQDALAKEISVAPQSLSRVMTGRRPPSPRLIWKISAALELTPEEEQTLLTVAGYGRGGTDDTGLPGPSQSGPDGTNLEGEMDATTLLEELLRRVDDLNVDVQVVRDLVRRALNRRSDSRNVDDPISG